LKEIKEEGSLLESNPDFMVGYWITLLFFSAVTKLLKDEMSKGGRLG
jgi:hypothetical protein